MREIPLTQGQVALVDDEDFERVNQYKWYALKHGDGFLAVRGQASRRHQESKGTPKTKKMLIRMHRFIMNVSDDMEVDHVNHNTLDNQKSNLRICTKIQNCYNRRAQGEKTSKYKGVSLHKRSGKWRAFAHQDGRQFYLGYFANEIGAAKKNDEKAQELFGEFAFLNFPKLGV